MKINKFKNDIDACDSYVIEVSPLEALELIKSLTSQLISKSCNVGRVESFTDKREYVSIAVIHDKDRRERPLRVID